MLGRNAILIRDRQGWSVYVHRIDGSLTRLARVTHEADARAAADEFSAALADGDPWAVRIVDVSAGELRG